MSTFLTDFIRVYENAIPNNICDEIITRFDKSEFVAEDVQKTEDEQQLMVRSCLELNLSKDDSFKDVQGAMTKIVELAIGKYQSEIPTRTFPKELGLEHFRIKKYRPGGTDGFAYHVDVNSHASARRFLSLIWYLNDVEQGGETFFPHPNVRVKPKKGRLLLFPSLWNYPHSGEPPVSNDKYILSTYLHYL